MEVRSAILLAIHSTSAALYLFYVPITAVLTWRATRQGYDGGKGVNGKWARWDSAGAEVGYLAVQCGTTLGEYRIRGRNASQGGGNPALTTCSCSQLGPMRTHTLIDGMFRPQLVGARRVRPNKGEGRRRLVSGRHRRNGTLVCPVHAGPRVARLDRLGRQGRDRRAER